MSYSVTPILHSESNKKGFYKIQIRIIYDRHKIYKSTKFSVSKNQFALGKVRDHPDASLINQILKKDVNEIERKIISFIDKHSSRGIAYLKDAIKDRLQSDTFSAFVEGFVEKYKSNFSKGTIAQYNVVAGKLESFRPSIRVSDIDYSLMCEFEASLRNAKKGNNTVVKNMQTLISLMNKAHKAGVIEKGSWGNYKKPKYIQNVPTWLIEEEINKFASIVFALGAGEKKQSGYYYLLCCYTGYRIGTAKKFDYNKSVTGSRIIIRATKNNRIVSMPIHSRLLQILEYCKVNPFSLSEQRARDHVKDICKLAGINKDLIFHSSRHSFAMLLMANGFTIDEVSELIGDSPLVAKVYARIHNDLLDKKIMEKLG